MSTSPQGEPGLIHIEIEPVWRFRREDDGRTTLVLLDFLNEIRASGKITRAAVRADMSYRHCWNLIEKWAAFFGAPLVERHQGRGTRLTSLGEKLVWAGQRLQARLNPQLQNLAQELETEINEVLSQRTKVVRIHASHGFAVSKLRELLSSLEPQLGIDLRYVSSQNSLASLSRGACDLAGVHLPIGELRGSFVADAKQWLVESEHRVVGLVTRELGLMVKPDNPLNIHSLEQLVAGDVRFVNRDPDSGTRRLLDGLLKEKGLDASRIRGYEHVEFTHAAVAAYVASGMADASFGVEAAARQFDLDFVPLVTEDYFFVCRKHTLENDSVQRLISVMRSEEFAAAVGNLPGYEPKDPGVVKGIREALR